MSESLEKLRSRILSDARIKADEILRETNEKAATITREAQEKAQREADEITAKAEAEAESARRSIISSRIRANRLKLLQERNRIVQSILDEVKESLSTIATSNGFQDTLKRLTTEAVDAVGSDKPIVRIGFPKVSTVSQSALGQSLPKGATVTYDEKIALNDLGGVVVSDPDGRVAYRNTFRARMDRLERELLTTISASIFGDQTPSQIGRVTAPIEAE